MDQRLRLPSGKHRAGGLAVSVLEEAIVQLVGVHQGLAVVKIAGRGAQAAPREENLDGVIVGGMLRGVATRIDKSPCRAGDENKKRGSCE